MKLQYTLLLSAMFAVSAHAVEPAGYYTPCENKGGSSLLSALCEKVGPHTVISYDGLLDLYKTSDVYPDGKIWDMYSTKHWTAGNTCGGGGYKRIGDCYNREHSMPKSWFNDAKPMYSDAFHLYPTDGKVNGQRSNYPYGECANGTREPSHAGVDALGKLGTSTFSGYSGKVFEPDDEYKGDFARSYFYMAAAYNDRIASWSSPMLAGNAYPAFTGWSVELLLKWHRQDPVSDKERNRQEAVYARQRNRNPFIDHPEMAEYIWGNKKKSALELQYKHRPRNQRSGKRLDNRHGYCSCKYSAQHHRECTRHRPQTGSEVSTTGDFQASVNSIPAASACTANGYNLGITFNASAQGIAKGTLTLQCGTLSTVVNLTAEAVSGLPADKPSDITDCGFTATWTNIGDADAQGNYYLFVTDVVDDEPIAGYPKAVKASDERFVVNDLMPSTEYGFCLRSESLASRTYYFSTSAPLPSIDFYFDGDLYLKSMPGEPGEAAEIEAEIENISGDISLNVTAPFQISTDHSNWATEAILPEGADRFYVRLYGDQPGEYSCSLVARAGDYYNDDAVISGCIGSVTNFTEDFEPEGTGSYNPHSYRGSACMWNFSDAGMWGDDPAHGGEHAVRAGRGGEGIIEMAEDAEGGIGTVSLWSRIFKEADGEARFELQYSTDSGSQWHTAGSASVKTTIYEEFHFTVNQPGKVRLRLVQTYGKRWYLDDLTATAYRGSTSVEDPDGYHSWDAYCLDGKLIIELAEAGEILVYGTDGIVYAAGTGMVGTNSYDLAPGLYLVAVNGRVRRVAVR